MAPHQQRLWPDPRPLVERLGAAFFRQVPPVPGVYFLRRGDEVLYVGKARNLRHRLGSYRVANPDRLPRRTLRLLRLAEAVTWEECADEAAALRREAGLLLALRPRFNRAGVWRAPPRHLSWRITADGLELAVLESAPAGWTCVGPLGSGARRLHQSLVRLLWCRLHPAAGLAAMPAGWFHGRHGPAVCLATREAAWLAEAHEQLAGLAAGGVDVFASWLPPVTAAFEAPLRDEDVARVGHLLGQARRP